MNEYGNTRLESADFCALSPVTTIRRANADESDQSGPQQAACDHPADVAVCGDEQATETREVAP